MPVKDATSIVLGDAIGGRPVVKVSPDDINKGNLKVEFATGSPMTVNPNASIPVDQLTLAEAISSGLVPKPDWWKPW